MNCPMCKGKGSEFNAVLYYGIGGGEYFNCDYCTGRGLISLAKWLYWYIVVIFWEEHVIGRIY